MKRIVSLLKTFINFIIWVSVGITTNLVLACPLVIVLEKDTATPFGRWSLIVITLITILTIQQILIRNEKHFKLFK